MNNEYQSGLNVGALQISRWIFTWGIAKAKTLVKQELPKHKEICSYNKGILDYYNDFLER